MNDETNEIANDCGKIRRQLEAKIDELKKDLAYSEMEKTYYKTSVVS